MGAKTAKPRPMDAFQKLLLSRTPATAQRVRYVGTAGKAFADAVQARNPTAEVLADTADPAPVDALTADDLARLLADPTGSALLAQAQVVTSLIPGGARDAGAVLSDLTSRGFTVLHLQSVAAPDPYFNDPVEDITQPWLDGRLSSEPTPAGLIVVARRDQQRPRLIVSMFTYAPTLMDIRTRLPAEALRSEPELLVQHTRPMKQLPPARMDQPKVFVLQRPAPPTDLDSWRQSTMARIRDGWITIMEFDDHPGLTAKANNREVRDADWVRFSWMHAVQTSTPLLKDLFQRYNPETQLFPNAVFHLEKFSENLPKRVFYGAVSRGPYAVDVAASLGPTIAQFPGVEFVVVGDKAVFEALPTSRKRYYDIVAYEEYLKLMGGCAISLSPVETADIYAAKSDAKFLDAAARSVLTIASPTIYADVVRHGENGLIANEISDWSPLLTDALRNDDARRRMTLNAWNYVRTSRMFHQQIPLRHAWYRDLWARREELNEALIRRMQG